MRFDLAADPWGTAMAAATVLWVLSLLVVVFAYVAGTSRRTGARLMLVALVGFLVAAAGGTWDRMRIADEVANQPEPAEPTTIIARVPPPDADGSPAVPGTGPNADGGTTSAGNGDGTDSGGSAAPDEPVPAGPEPTPLLPTPVSAIPTVDPFPTDADAQAAAARTILRESGAVATEPRRCADLDAVALAWAQLQTIPDERRWASRSKGVAQGLEQCRRKLLYSISRRHRRTLVDARDEFTTALAERMRKDHDLGVAVTVSGNSHERLRIWGKDIDATRAETLMAGRLRAELRSIEFARVSFTNGKTTKKYDLEVTPESKLGLPDLAAVGLGTPLQ